jgi:hypothetical protein
MEPLNWIDIVGTLLVGVLCAYVFLGAFIFNW